MMSVSKKWENTQLVFFLLALCSGSFSIAVSQIALGVAVLCSGGRWLHCRQGWVETGTERTTVVLVGWALLMIPLSTHPLQSLVFFRRFYLFTGLWLGASLATGEHRRRLMMGALLVGAVGVSLLAVVSMAQSSDGLFVRRLDQISNPMTSGGVLMIIMLVGVGVLLKRGISRRSRVVVGGALAPVLLALVLTMTRSALLGLSVGVAAMLLVSHRRWFVAVAVVFVVLSLGVATMGEQVLPPHLWARISPDYIIHGDNTVVRLAMWKLGWQMFLEKPWFGVGDCDLVGIAPPTFGAGFPFVIGHLHNNLVQLAVIWGGPGLLFALLFWGQQLRLLWHKWVGFADGGAGVEPWRGAWLLGALGMWTGFFVAGLTEWYFGDAEPMLLYMAVMGVALGAARRSPSSAAPNLEIGVMHV